MTIRQKFIDFVEARRAVRELNSLSARQLADIGITRGDIASVVRNRGN
jgi:uncharacterized protein YjiS (DUF1127 family)